MEESDDNESARYLRKRPKKAELPVKRRKSTINCAKEESIKEIYLQENAKVSISSFRPSSLETIYESPKGKTCSKMGLVKLKRHCNFPAFYNPPKHKIKQRKTRAKSVKRIGTKSSQLANPVTLEHVMKVIEELSDSENEENQLNVSNLSNMLTPKTENPWCYKNNVIYPDDSFSEINNLSSNLADMKMDVVNPPEIKCDVGTIAKKSDPLDLGLDPLLDFESPRLTVREKQKKHRRRSGRVDTSGFCIENLNKPIDSDIQNLSIPVPVFQNFEEQNKSGMLCNSSQTFVETINVDSTTDELSNKKRLLEPKVCSTSQQGKCKTQKVEKRKRGRPRRVSGITRPLYNSLLNISVTGSSPQSAASSPESRDNLSPCSLFQDLNIKSPSSDSNDVELNKSKCNRRRSARLSRKSFGIGTVLAGGSSPKSSPSIQPKTIIFPSTSTQQFLPKATNPVPKKMNCVMTESSPIISGMFDSRGMILKGKKITVKNKQLNLNHFNTQSFFNNH